MNRTTVLRTIVLVLFCTFVATYSFAQVHNSAASGVASPTAPEKPQNVSAPGKPNLNSNEAVRVDPKDMPRLQDGSVAPATFAPVEIRTKDGKLEKTLTKQEDIIAHHQKPKVSPEQKAMTPEAVEKFKKDYLRWMSRNTNWQNVLSEMELSIVNRSAWTQLYNLAMMNSTKGNPNQPNNNK